MMSLKLFNWPSMSVQDYILMYNLVTLGVAWECALLHWALSNHPINVTLVDSWVALLIPCLLFYKVNWLGNGGWILVEHWCVFFMWRVIIVVVAVVPMSAWASAESPRPIQDILLGHVARLYWNVSMVLVIFILYSWGLSLSNRIIDEIVIVHYVLKGIVRCVWVEVLLTASMFCFLDGLVWRMNVGHWFQLLGVVVRCLHCLRWTNLEVLWVNLICNFLKFQLWVCCLF